MSKCQGGAITTQFLIKTGLEDGQISRIKIYTVREIAERYLEIKGLVTIEKKDRERKN